ncbi:MAG: hypothetical protein CXZ00_08765 [Acidobacteria bacterium]|nr:MAG: hypothetical protein CXZ00_08765 [Acidobacteriota bacterium]
MAFASQKSQRKTSEPSSLAPLAEHAAKILSSPSRFRIRISEAIAAGTKKIDKLQVARQARNDKNLLTIRVTSNKILD